MVLLLSMSHAYGMMPLASPTPPPPPQVPPIISMDYASDWDGNRINDKLELSAPAEGEVSIASIDGEMVSVELVFREPVTQMQIDEFLRLGGQITYLYRAISYGWTGRVPRASLAALPAALGPTLVQVEPIQRLEAYLDVATQTGRVRPLWQAGFGGNPTGFSGDPNTTIGFIGSGIDAQHTDLKGRGIYWRDFSDDNEPAPVDFEGHESAVAGVALGTGAKAGANKGALRLTYAMRWSGNFHMPFPICLPDGIVTVNSTAEWTGPAASLLLYDWRSGTLYGSVKMIGNYSTGSSPLSISNTWNARNTEVVAPVLVDSDNLKNLGDVVITNSVSSYPSVQDGFNKFRGVAPNCKWAAAKVLDKEGNADSEQFTAAFDDLVLHRRELNLKIINVSFGLQDELGFPEESTSLRDKVNSVVNNGILVVAAAGNNATKPSVSWRRMADPARAAQALTVGAVNDNDELTEYSNYGFPDPRPEVGEDFKPDVVAPGGSQYYTGILTVDSGTSDSRQPDKEPDDYVCEAGTSFAAPFVAGSAALVIQAMERQGIVWRFDSSEQPRYVKMLLCATASETNAKREGDARDADPTVQRAATGPNGFPTGKDQYEGYGLINPDAAVEAVSLTLAAGNSASVDLGGPTAAAKRTWARTVNLRAGCGADIALTNLADLYLYSAVPTDTGTPVLLASGTLAGGMMGPSIHYVPTADTAALLVVKRGDGQGKFTVSFTQSSPPIAADIRTYCAVNGTATITLKATDEGGPNPLRYTLLSRPAQGRLELPDGTLLVSVPAQLPIAADKVIFRPPTDWSGQVSFTYRADDGGTPPSGGPSNTASAVVTVKGVTLEYGVEDKWDDWSTNSSVNFLYIGVDISALRFCAIRIPQGATIVGATLKICAASAKTVEVDGVLKGEAADNASAFTSGGWQTTRPMTAASMGWKWTAAEPWVANVWYDSPDLGPVIQEIVDRPGWSSGDALVVFYTVNTLSSSNREFWAYDNNPNKAAKLSITYEPK
jgi:subtilisin family serine protease